MSTDNADIASHPLPRSATTPTTTTTTTTTNTAAGAAGGTPSSSITIANTKVDPKLFHLVKKMITASCTDRNNPNIDYIVTILRTQHREYLRKDLERLKAQVGLAVRQMNSHYGTTSSSTGTSAAITTTTSIGGVGVGGEITSTTVSATNATTNSGRKRKNRVESSNNSSSNVRRLQQQQQQKEEEEYDEAAAKHDALQQQILETSGGGGGLNAALRDRYRKIATKSAADESPVVVAAFSSNANITAEEPEPGGLTTATRNSQNLQRESQQPAAPNQTSMEGKSPKVKRKTVKMIRRSSSSMGLAGGSDSMGMGTPFVISPCPRPTERYSDLGGMDQIIRELRQLIEYPLKRPELYKHLGVDPPRGVLLRGPPGTGKTHFANAVAGELGVPYFRVSAPELVSGMSGESEGRIRDLFAAASDMAPALIFLDEIDAIAPKRGGEGSGGGVRGMEKRMVAQLLTCLDRLAPENNNNQAAVMVLAATNRPDALDSALRRAGRFDKEILLGVPDEDARECILRTMTKNMRLSGDFDFKVLARKTPGFVGADVHSLAKEAAVLAISRIVRDVLQESVEDTSKSSVVVGPGTNSDAADDTESGVISGSTPLSADQMENLYITMEDFLNAVPLVQPSSKREGFATVPDVSWNDIGALKIIREELTISVLEPIRCPEKFKALGLSLPAGVLLFGPPGCGKTLLAKAIANESGANFISVKGPELLDKYVGESERAVRVVFERARSSSPCIVFFDELDSLVPKRGSDSGGGGVSERVVNQLLTELDGLESRRSVFVIAATNRPELIDPAMLRPGRLDKLLYVPLPTPEDRASILKALATNVALGNDVDLDVIGRSPRAEGYSGADCAALIREAGLAVLKEDAAAHSTTVCNESEVAPLSITSRHFDVAFASVMPSVSRKDQARYDRIRDRISRARCRGQGIEKEAVNDDDGPAAADDAVPLVGTERVATKDADEKSYDVEK